MKDFRTFMILMLMLVAQCIFVACGDDDDPVDSVNEHVTIGDDGKASNGSAFSSIDDKNFYLDYIKYTVKEGHLVVSGYDKSGFKGMAKIVSSITYKGNFYEVLEIGEGAFKNCASLTSITIPNSVTSIGYHAFQGCTSLPVEDNIRYADTYAVEAVDKTLSTYTIKNGTRFIGSSAFRDCSSLASINIPNGVTTIGERAFDHCSSLTSINIPNGVTSIGYSVFHGCSGLTSITIPNSVTSIGHSAFYGCTNLTSVTIPNSVTSIDTYAFQYCRSLTSVTVEATIPPTLYDFAFYYTASDIKIYVPAESVNAYKTTNGWNEYGSRIYAIS